MASEAPADEPDSPYYAHYNRKGENDRKALDGHSKKVPSMMQRGAHSRVSASGN